MTDDQTPGVAAMGDDELVRAFVVRTDELADFAAEQHGDIYYPSPLFTQHETLCNRQEEVIEEVTRRLRLAAGPTKAEILAAVSHQLSKRGYVKLDGNIAYCEIHEALTALWPDGEHQADAVTVELDRDEADALIPKLMPTAMHMTEPRQLAKSRAPSKIRSTLATARPHQADPQEAM